MSTPAQILVSNTILQLRETEVPREMAGSRLGQKIYNMYMEYLVESESRPVLKLTIQVLD